jgi:hypothetical protein
MFQLKARMPDRHGMLSNFEAEQSSANFWLYAQHHSQQLTCLLSNVLCVLQAAAASDVLVAPRPGRPRKQLQPRRNPAVPQVVAPKRKPGRPPKRKPDAGEADGAAPAAVAGEAPERKRGRPPKHKPEATAPVDPASAGAAVDVPKRKRGRPPKQPQAAATTPSAGERPKKRRGRPPKLQQEAPAGEAASLMLLRWPSEWDRLPPSLLSDPQPCVVCICKYGGAILINGSTDITGDTAPAAADAPAVPAANTAPAAAAEEPPRKKRGRPPGSGKKKQPQAASPGTGTGPAEETQVCRRSHNVAGWLAGHCLMLCCCHLTGEYYTGFMPLMLSCDDGFADASVQPAAPAATPRKRGRPKGSTSKRTSATIERSKMQQQPAETDAMEVDSPADAPPAAEVPEQGAGAAAGAGDATGPADAGTAEQAGTPKRKRGRPPGSGTKPKPPPGVHICSTWMDEFAAQSRSFAASPVASCMAAWLEVGHCIRILCRPR